MNDIQAKISHYLASHLYLRLGTITNKATPQVHTVGYVSEGCTVYFVTDKKSRKAKNIFSNPAVAYAVDENYTDVFAIKGVQMEGKASLVTMETEAMRILDIMAQKFPGMDALPLDPESVLFRVEPTMAYFLDNTIKFGHRDMTTFSNGSD